MFFLDLFLFESMEKSDRVSCFGKIFRAVTWLFCFLEIQELQSDGNVHLKDFFLVVPALMISAIEAMLQAKDKLFKRSRTSADSLFTDDGFVLGIAYLLKVGYSFLPIHQILVFKWRAVIHH